MWDGVFAGTLHFKETTALGVGLARVIKGRNPMLDGFGLTEGSNSAPGDYVIEKAFVGDGV